MSSLSGGVGRGLTTSSAVVTGKFDDKKSWLRAPGQVFWVGGGLCCERRGSRPSLILQECIGFRGQGLLKERHNSAQVMGFVWDRRKSVPAGLGSRGSAHCP